MTRKDIIEAFCVLQRDAQEHIGFDHAADCFCSLRTKETLYADNYQNDGAALEFIQKAVAEKIKAEKELML
jgi:hypothetical protein